MRKTEAANNVPHPQGFGGTLTSAGGTENLTAIWQRQLSDPSSNNLSYRNEQQYWIYTYKDALSHTKWQMETDKWKPRSGDKWQGMCPRTIFESCGYRISNPKLHLLSTHPTPIAHCVQHKTLGNSPPTSHTLEDLSIGPLLSGPMSLPVSIFQTHLEQDTHIFVSLVVLS